MVPEETQAIIDDLDLLTPMEPVPLAVRKTLSALEKETSVTLNGPADNSSEMRDTVQ